MLDIDTLKEKHLKEKVAELSLENNQLKAELVFLRSKVILLEKQKKSYIKKLSKVKCRNKELFEMAHERKPKTRCDKALAMIKRREEGEDMTLKQISEKCFLSYSTVKSLARDYRKGKYDG